MKAPLADAPRAKIVVKAPGGGHFFRFGETGAVIACPKARHHDIRLMRGADGNFVAVVGSREMRAKTVLVASGVINLEPDLPDVENAVRRGLMRHCDICDGYEISGLKVGVIGHGEQGLGEALFLRTYTDDITLLSLDENCIRRRSTNG